MSDDTKTDGPTNLTPTELFESISGSWTGTSSTWFEPEKLADTSEVAGTIAILLAGRFCEFNYTSTVTEEPFEGRYLFGFNTDRETFQAVWVDSFHMGSAMMSCEGRGTPTGFSVIGAYDVPGGPPWGWRTEVTLEHPKTLTVTMYNITPDGQEDRGVEFTLMRETK